MPGPNNGQVFPVSVLTGREAFLFHTPDTLITIQACAGNLHVSLALALFDRVHGAHPLGVISFDVTFLAEKRQPNLAP